VVVSIGETSLKKREKPTLMFPARALRGSSGKPINPELLGGESA
jgi:hypothetical protein